MHQHHLLVDVLFVIVGLALGFAIGVYWAAKHPVQAAKVLTDEQEVQAAVAHVGKPPTEPASTVQVPVNAQGQPLGAPGVVLEPSQTTVKPIKPLP